MDGFGRTGFRVGVLYAAVTVTCVVAYPGCTSGNSCETEADCFAGQVCGADGVCVSAAGDDSGSRDGGETPDGGDTEGVDTGETEDSGRSEGDGGDTEPTDTESGGHDTAVADGVTDTGGRDGDGRDGGDACGGWKRPGQDCTRDCECRSTCRAGKCVHRVFVTSTAGTGDFRAEGGGFDQEETKAICDAHAESAGLDGSWDAVLSVSSGLRAKARIEVRTAVDNLCGDGERVANSGDEFWGASHRAPIQCDEHGERVTDPPFHVWSGSLHTGYAHDANCDSWKRAEFNALGRTGRLDVGDGREWLNNKLDGGDGLGCHKKAHLYCIDGQ